MLALDSPFLALGGSRMGDLQLLSRTTRTTNEFSLGVIPNWLRYAFQGGYPLPRLVRFQRYALLGGPPVLLIGICTIKNPDIQIDTFSVLPDLYPDFF